jgi:two-component system cell cycle sensor histidine kinase/response regulator CckA
MLESLPPPAMEPADTTAVKLGTILVVEDMEFLLELVVTVLNSANFAVLQADSGPGALSTAADHPGAIDLLLSDVYLPGMSGVQMAEILKQSRPGMQVILMSAFSGGDLLAAKYGWTFIQKPFTSRILLEMVNRVLHRANTSQTHCQFDSTQK